MWAQTSRQRFTEIPNATDYKSNVHVPRDRPNMTP